MSTITKDEVAVNLTEQIKNDRNNYRVISLALDLTGKKLIDEICQIGAFYDTSENGRFAYYIMPYRDMSYSAIRNHGVKIVVNSGYFRVMKNVFTLREVRTRTEYVTLCDFIDWLKKVVAGFDGVIFVYHDVTPGSMRVTPYLLEALDRYKMTDDFFHIVKGFVNLTDIAKTHPDYKDKSLSFFSMSRRGLKVKEQREFLSARRRAEMTYKLLTKLTTSAEGGDESTPLTIPVSKLLEFCSNKSEELIRLESQRELTRKVVSLKPIFLEQIRKNEKERKRAVILRSYVIDAALDYDTLKECAASGCERIKELLVKVPTKLNKKKDEEIEDLVKLIMNYFTKDKTNDTDGGKGKGDSSFEKEKEAGQGEGKDLGTPRADSNIETEEEREAETEAETEYETEYDTEPETEAETEAETDVEDV